ncbi:hypothetical protein RFI_16554, partial [Reticulomyxa filosa]
AHRDADNEFLGIADRQQWSDGTTSVSCVLLPGRDLLHLLSNPKHELVKKGKANPSDRIRETIEGAMNGHGATISGGNENNSNNSNLDDNKNNKTNSDANDSNKKNNNNNPANTYKHGNSNSNSNSNTNNSTGNDQSKSDSNSFGLGMYEVTDQDVLGHSHGNNEQGMDVTSASDEPMVISPDMCEDGDTWLFVANTGDSRAVLVKEDGTAVPMSFDHKPNKPEERKRIENSGGVLAVARSLGDRHLKKWVIPDPEIRCRKIQDTDLLLLLASDGVWDVISNDDAAKLAVDTWNNAAYRNSSIKERLQFVASKLTSIAYRNGSMDNITTLVVHLKSHCTSKGQVFKEHKNAIRDSISK